MDKAQAFTLEGVMAALLLLLVMYTFFQSSLVVSPMWSELTDAQLRLLANDALKVLDNSTKVDIGGKRIYLNDSLQGMIATLGEDFKSNSEFESVLQRLVYPANYRLEVCWIESISETNTINCTAIISNTPTPEAVMGSRYIVISKSDLGDSVFNNLVAYDPVVFEVRLILWRP
ncbi:MAG: hypothetical protein QXK70_04920 [Archaeoglobaceae archaeon]